MAAASGAVAPAALAAVSQSVTAAAPLPSPIGDAETTDARVVGVGGEPLVHEAQAGAPEVLRGQGEPSTSYDSRTASGGAPSRRRRVRGVVHHGEAASQGGSGSGGGQSTAAQLPAAAVGPTCIGGGSGLTGSSGEDLIRGESVAPDSAAGIATPSSQQPAASRTQLAGAALTGAIMACTSWRVGTERAGGERGRKWGGARWWWLGGWRVAWYPECRNDCAAGWLR